MLDAHKTVRAVRLCESDLRLDIGTAESYWTVLMDSHRLAT
jgi:hypothetical protein